MQVAGETTNAWRLPVDSTAYLTGQAFNPQYRLSLEPSRVRAPRARWEFLLSVAAGRNVLHMGCLDHEPLIHDKIALGTWLHSALRRVSHSCVGVDINGDVITALRSRYGFEDIHAFDVLKAELPRELVQAVDVVMLPDVLEHIATPVEFLAALRRNFPDPAPTLVLTVPSAATLDNALRALRAREWINSDHYVSYTPYTLARVVAKGGWVPGEIFFLDYALPPRATGLRTLARGHLLRRYPALRDTIALVCA